MPKIKVTHLSGSRSGRVDECHTDGVIKIGRQIDTDISFDPIEDSVVSSYHAEIRCMNGVWSLVDLGSSNGTFLDDEKIDASAAISVGSEFSLGRKGPRLRVDLLEPVSPKQTADTLMEVAPEAIDEAKARLEELHRLGQDTQDNVAVVIGNDTIPMPQMSPEPSPTGSANQGGKTGLGANTVSVMIRDQNKPLRMIIAGLAVLLVVSIILAVFFISQAYDEDAALIAQAEEAQSARLDEARATSALAIEAASSASTKEIEALESGVEESGVAIQDSLQKMVTEEMSNLHTEFDNKLTEHVDVVWDEFEGELAAMKADTDAQLKAQLEANRELIIADAKDASEEIGTLYNRAVYLLITDVVEFDGYGYFGPFCTAFAISDDGLLATNSHCVEVFAETMESLRDELYYYRDYDDEIDIEFYVKQSGDSETRYPVSSFLIHPEYTGAESPDVGLVQLDLSSVPEDKLVNGKLPVVTKLASTQTLQSLAMAQSIFTIGFPGMNMDAEAVIGEFRGGHVSRLTDYEHTDASYENNTMLWHTAMISKGTSGSPIFNRQGEVIAVNNSTFQVYSVEVDDGSYWGGEEQLIYSAEGLSAGIRIDVLQQLWEGAESGLLKMTEVPDVLSLRVK